MEIINEWRKTEHARDYLARINDIPHRTEGEAALLEHVPPSARRVLDLGCGDGRLLALVKSIRPQCQGVALDFSPTMLEAARQRFANDPAVEVRRYDFETPLPEVGSFDAIVSSFAIHHATDERKRALYAEVFQALGPGGVFCNLEHVASVSSRRHAEFLAFVGHTPETEDPSNKLVPAEVQLDWLRQIGFEEVDCYWRWRELALLVGSRGRNTPFGSAA